MNNIAVKAFALALLLSVCGSGFAHPEDELCHAGPGVIDPQLCALLAEMDRTEGAVVQDELLVVFEAERGFMANLTRYVRVGLDHILPGGLDHILFVVALFLAAKNLRSLIWLITAFTFAHSVTLALAATGIMVLPPSIVEPLIPFTIAFVAIENLFDSPTGKWRTFIVFAFGLIHGLGFAGFFGELGLPEGLFLSSLIGFNLGVEAGQIAVIAITAIAAGLANWLLRALAMRDKYPHFIVRPVSALIGLIGLYWGWERLLGVG
jgi:hypothetical protein